MSRLKCFNHLKIMLFLTHFTPGGAPDPIPTSHFLFIKNMVFTINLLFKQTIFFQGFVPGVIVRTVPGYIHPCSGTHYTK